MSMWTILRTMDRRIPTRQQHYQKQERQDGNIGHNRIRSLTVLCLIASSFQVSTSYALPHPSRYTSLPTTTTATNPTSTRPGVFLQSSSRSSSESSESEAAVETPLRGGGASSPPPPPPPTLRQLLQFAVPCLGLWISGPLLSLVDTASVGLTAQPGTGAVQLGALGPATTFIDGATYLFAFLNVATTNLYAAAMAKKGSGSGAGGGNEKEAGDGVARTATKVSLICGVALLGVILLTNQRLLEIYVGSKATPGSLVSASSEYVVIRSLSMPTSLLAGVLQASLLGAKDSVTPLIAVAASTIVNVLGDLFCVVKLGMGCKGAAIATLLAQWAGTIALLRPAKRKLFVTKPRRPEHKVSSLAFLSFAAPVLTLILGKITAFGVMTHVAASLPAKASLAAHQLVLSLFFFVSPFLEVISQTAQTFLPQYYVGAVDAAAAAAAANNNNNEDASNQYAQRAQDVAGRLLRIGLVVGTTVATLASAIPKFLPQLLTNDETVRMAVRPLALPLFLGCVLTAPVAVSEGVLLAKRELKYLAGVYVVSTAVFPFFLMGIKRVGGPVKDVWVGFALFQLFRAVCFTGKLWGRKVLEWGGIGTKVDDGS